MALLADGFSTLITLSLGSVVTIIQEKEVQPPKLSGGGGIDTTSMRTVGLRTKQPKSLATTEDITVHVLYDPLVYFTLGNIHFQKLQTITVRFPDGTISSWPGWLDEIGPPLHKEGELPVCELKFIPSNQNLAMTSQTAPIVPGGTLTPTGRG